jgi:pimeloyl-ACP methyl ester carboxylesterase
VSQPFSALPHDEAGSGPPVVLLHAGIADRRMWSEHVDPLARANLRVVALDLPGFGEAPPAAGEDAPWNDLIATLEELEIERATLVGNSFGGAVALRVAAVAPRRVEGMVLVSAAVPGVEPSAALRAAWGAEEDALESDDVEGAIRAVLEHWLPPDAPDGLRSRIAAMQRRAFELQLGGEETPEAEDPLEEGLAPLAANPPRTLVLVGQHDMEDFHAGAELLTQALPDVRRVVLPDVAHLAPLEAPEAFRELVLGFVAGSGAAD